MCLADATCRYLLTWVAAWFLLFQNFAALLFVPVLAQIVFVFCLMPVPLVRLPATAAT